MFIFGRYKQLYFDEALTMDVHSVWNWAEKWTKMLIMIIVFSRIFYFKFILDLKHYSRVIYHIQISQRFYQ